MIIYDFEVYKYDWLVVFMDLANSKQTVIVNNSRELRKFYEKNLDEIYIGYNNKHYDQYIYKGLLLGLNPYDISQFIIAKKQQGWKYSREFRSVRMIQYDVKNSLDRGLKVLEGFMGSSIEETSVPFDLDRKLTKDELDLVIKYCKHDVFETFKVFVHRMKDYSAQLELLKMFDLPLVHVEKTKVQLSATILEARKRNYDDEFDIDLPPTLKLDKYKHIAEWYLDKSNRDYKKRQKVEIAGIPHILAWGGIHGAIDQYSGDGEYVLLDVESMYPMLMIHYDLLSRSCNPEKFKTIVDQRLQWKHEGDGRESALKIVINGTYGAMKDKYNPLYDPRQANRVCVYGQLLIVDLIEKIEPYCKVIQSNTDGVLVKLLDDKSLIDFDLATREWQERTKLKLDYEFFSRIRQKDVNNYVFTNMEGEVTSKGAFSKFTNVLDNNLAVVNRAVRNYLAHDIPVRDTIMEANKLIDFQLVKRIGRTFDTLVHGNEDLQLTTSRVFSCIEGKTLYKRKGTAKHKVEGTPRHSRVVNGNIEDEPVPEWLDRQWYIDEAEKRVRQYVV